MIKVWYIKCDTTFVSSSRTQSAPTPPAAVIRAENEMIAVSWATICGVFFPSSRCHAVTVARHKIMLVH